MASIDSQIDYHRAQFDLVINGLVGLTNRMEALAATRIFTVDLVNPQHTGNTLPGSIQQAINDAEVGKVPAKPSITIPAEQPPRAPTFKFSAFPNINIPLFTKAPPTLAATAPKDIAFPKPIAVKTDTYKDPAIPDTFNIQLPTVPTLDSVVVPSFTPVTPTLITPTLKRFAATAPTRDFSFTEEKYSSELLALLNNRLAQDMASPTFGQDSTAELELWDRATERDLSAVEAQVDELERAFVTRRFSIPPGTLFGAIDQARQNAQMVSADANREIVIRRADQFLDWRKFTYGAATQVEQMMIGHHQGVMERMLRVADLTFNGALSLFQAKVAEHNQFIAEAQFEIQVLDARIREAQIALENHRLELDAARTRGDLRKDALENYRIQVAALDALINVHRLNIERANTQLSANDKRLDVARYQIEHFRALADVEQAELSSYEAITRGDENKVRVYESEIRAHSATLDGLAARARLAEAEANNEVQQAELKLRQFDADSQNYRTRLDTAIAKANLQSNLYRDEVSAYSNKVGATASLAELDIRNYLANRDSYYKSMDVQLAESRLFLDAIKASLDTQLNANSAAGTFYSNAVSGLANGLSSAVSLVTSNTQA